jgi:hypothetical protein
VIEGTVTCGWLNTDEHDQCESSVSIEQSMSVFPSQDGSPAFTRNLSTAAGPSYSSCPPPLTIPSVVATSLTSSSVSTLSPTAKSAANRIRIRIWKSGIGLVMMGSLFLILL